MSTTFLDRLTADEGRDLRLYFTIDGIADVFQEDAVDVPTAFVASGRTRQRVIQSIDHGQSEIDLDSRRMVGGSLRATLLDDEAGTLASLFSSRRRRTTWVTGTTTATATTINVQSTSNLASSGTVYIGSETVTYTGKTATTLTGCTRGAYGSKALRHYGGSVMGAPVFVSPPRWVGRRVRLYGYFMNDGATTTTNLRQQLDTFRIEEAPTYVGNGRWELRCSHLSDEIAQRKLGQGLAALKAYAASPTLSGTTKLKWQIVGQSNLWPTPTTSFFATHAAIKYQDTEGISVLRYRASADLPIVTEIETDLDGDRGNVNGRLTSLVPEEIEHWAILSGNEISALALIALLSKLGDATNTAYDILPGTNRDSGIHGEQLQFGAGIDSTEVNDTAINAALTTSNGSWSYVIDETIDVKDFLADLCLVTQTFWYVSYDGKLSMKKLSEERQTTSMAINDSVVIGEPTVEVLEDVIYPRATIRCGYDPGTGEFKDSVTVVDTEMADRYPERGDTLQLETRALCLSQTTISRPICSRAQLETIVRRAMIDDSRGRMYVTLNATLAALRLDLGDVVNIDLDLPDYEGGTLMGRTGRVVSRRPRYDDGVVELRVQVIERLRYIAPACVIASAVGATMTLRTSGFETASTSPANMFAVGQYIEVVFVATGTVEVFTVQSVTAPATVVLSGTPVGAITGGADYLRIARGDWNATGAPSTAVSANGYVAPDFVYMMPEQLLNSDTRWR